MTEPRGEPGDLPSHRIAHGPARRALGPALAAKIFVGGLLLCLATQPASAERDGAAPGAPLSGTADGTAVPPSAASPPSTVQGTAGLPGQQTAVAGSLATHLGAGDSLEIAGQSLPGALLRDSYAAAGYGPIWTEDKGISPAGAVLIDQLQAAKSAGMSMIDPLLAAIAEHAGAKTPDELADLDLLLSAALLAATADSGDMPPATLLAAARKGDPRSFVANHLPGTFFYWGLRQALPVYRQYAAGPAWPTVPAGPKLEKGMTDPRVRGAPAAADGDRRAERRIRRGGCRFRCLRRQPRRGAAQVPGKPRARFRWQGRAPDHRGAQCFGCGPAELDPPQYGAIPRALAQHGRALSLCECRRDGAFPGRAGTGDLSQPRDRRTGGPQDAAAAKRDQAHRLQSDLGRAGEDRADRHAESPAPGPELFPLP